MKKLLLLCFALACVAGLRAQNYTIANSVGTTSPYELLPSPTPGNSIFALPQNDTYSAWQTLPFTFTFYGQPVTGYKVSDNGYLTFDQNEVTSQSANIALPSAAAPKKAIFAMWDDWSLASGNGTADGVYAWTYGTAPQRVHVIQWASVSHMNVNANYGWLTIRLYECGDFDVIHDWFQTTTTGITSTVGAQDATGANGVQVTGSPTFGYSTGLPSQPANDDKVYSFVWSGIAYDLSVNSLNIPTGNFREFLVKNTPYTLTGTIQNAGSNAVTSFNLNYSINNGAPVTQNVTGINLAPGASYNYSHTTPYNPGVAGTPVTIKVFADMINGSQTDSRSCNDYIAKRYQVVNGNSGSKHVLIEEFTGAWCGYCPDGALRLEQILTSTPNSIGVSVHDNDQMAFTDNIRTFFQVSSYPSGSVDRFHFKEQNEPKIPVNRGFWQTYTTDRMNDFTPVNVGITQSYNATTRTITGNVTADFTDYGYGNMRMVLMVVEDSMSGTGTGWNQVNYYSSAGSAAGGSGHYYYNFGDPIVGFVHRDVLRALPWGHLGDAADITDTIPMPSGSYTKPYTYTFPSGAQPGRSKIIAFVGYYDPSSPLKNNILNSAEIVVGAPTSIDQTPLVSNVEVYPNPVNNLGYVEMTFTETTDARVSVINMYGQEMAVLREGGFAAGKHVLNFSTEGVAPGVYFVRVEAGEKTFTKKVVVSH